MVNRKRELLADALVNKHIIEFWYRFDAGSTLGYVLDIGPQFFLVANIDDSMRFDGYQIVQVKNLRRMQAPARYGKFVASALRQRKQRINRRPNIKLGGISEILESANRLFPLITIYRENIKPDSCWIGRIADLTDSAVRLHEIGPDAVWDKEPSSHRLSQITRVEFGGGYEEALLLVGGGWKSKQRQRNHAS